MSLVGPLFRHELTRLARRGLQPRLRAVFAALLLGALLLTYLQEFPGANPARALVRVDQPMSIDQASHFGERFLTAFLVVQLVVVVVVTPAVVGGAMAEERQRGSLDFLLCSPLSSREIVLGKMAARLVFVGGVVLTGLPVLMLTIFFGGVDTETLLAGYAVTLLTVLSLGAYSLYHSVQTGELRATLVRAYRAVAVLTVFGFCCGPCLQFPGLVSPFPTLMYLLVAPWKWRTSLGMWATVGLYAGLHLAVAWVFLWAAVGSLRKPAPGRPAPLDRTVFGDAGPLPLGHPGVTRRDRFVPRLGDDEDPLRWKETWFGGRIGPPPDSPDRAILGAALLAVGGCALFILLGVAIDQLHHGLPVGEIFGPVGRFMAAVLLPAVVLGVGLRAAGSVAAERQRQTLDALLALPGDRADVLRAKAAAALRAVRPAALTLVGFLAAGWVTGGFPLVVLVTAPALVVGWSAAGLGVGMWLSVRCPTPARATGYFLGAILTASVLPPLASGLVRDSVGGRGDPTAELAEAVADGLSPVTGTWNGLPVREAFVTGRASVGAGAQPVGSLIGAAAAGLAGAAYWWATVRRFRGEGG